MKVLSDEEIGIAIGKWADDDTDYYIVGRMSDQEVETEKLRVVAQAQLEDDERDIEEFLMQHQYTDSPTGYYKFTLDDWQEFKSKLEVLND